MFHYGFFFKFIYRILPFMQCKYVMQNLKKKKNKHRSEYTHIANVFVRKIVFYRVIVCKSNNTHKKPCTFSSYSVSFHFPSMHSREIHNANSSLEYNFCCFFMYTFWCCFIFDCFKITRQLRWFFGIKVKKIWKKLMQKSKVATDKFNSVQCNPPSNHHHWTLSLEMFLNGFRLKQKTESFIQCFTTINKCKCVLGSWIRINYIKLKNVGSLSAPKLFVLFDKFSMQLFVRMTWIITQFNVKFNCVYIFRHFQYIVLSVLLCANRKRSVYFFFIIF